MLHEPAPANISLTGHRGFSTVPVLSARICAQLLESM